MDKVRVERSVWNDFDSFFGTEEALIAAGLITADQLPGKPGRGRTRSTFLADGTPLRPGWPRGMSKEPGRKVVSIYEQAEFRVDITVSLEEQQRRGLERTRRLTEIREKRESTTPTECALREAPAKRQPTQQPAALPSNVVPFPLERSKARPVVMKGRVIPMADIQADLKATCRTAQRLVAVAFEKAEDEVRERLEGRHG